MLNAAAPLQLHLRDIAAGKPFHAALVVQRSAYGDTYREKTLSHYHDFWELMYVLEGSGTHWLDEQPYPLDCGNLLLIRPKDVHAVQASPGQTLYFLNIAFLEDAWYDFCVAARFTPNLASWATATQPLVVAVPAEEQGDCAAAFQRALHTFVNCPTHLDLCSLWSAVLPFFVQPHSLTGAETAPVWLERARQLMQEEANLRGGLPRLGTLSGVSQAHLARTFKHYYGQTPTEFVNELRLKYAATLLTTTPGSIADVAEDCGFSNLSYFYRRFSRRFGCPPRAFRLAASRQVVPKA